MQVDWEDFKISGSFINCMIFHAVEKQMEDRRQASTRAKFHNIIHYNGHSKLFRCVVPFRDSTEE